jgi:hypothetical protein
MLRVSALLATRLTPAAVLNHADLTTKFLDSNLPAALSEGNVFAWLKTCSKLNLCGLATTCIAYIVEHQLALPVLTPAGFLATLNTQQADQLYEAQREAPAQATLRCAALQEEAVALRLTDALYTAQCRLVSSLQNTLSVCAKPKERSPTLCRCGYRRFVKPNGKDASFCINCGREM